MPRKITEVTRRDIREALSSLNLWGRLDEIEFLDRLYDLDALPSTDSRFETARQDITQHRLANDDWRGDWICYDDRFELKDGDDQVLLRFLAELVHPVVRSDQEDVAKITRALNDLLSPDGYRLAVREYISGRPVYASIEIPPEPLRSHANAQHFTEDVRPLLATVARLAELDGSPLEQEVLRSAEPHLEQPEYDNWDGGTYYYTLDLIVPVDVFARLGDQVPAIEERIGNRIKGILRVPDRHHIIAAVIQPSMVDRPAGRLADVVVARSERPIPQFWAPGQLRLFISHVTSFKQRATALRQELSRFCISGFVAHETIEPGTLWQREIEAALRTMDAMAALITPDFHESKWTDQEVGWAFGAGVYVLPVRRGADPYGFLGEVQGIQGLGKKVPEVAAAIFETLLRFPKTNGVLLEAVVVGFESSDSYKAARESVALLESVRVFPEPLLRRIEVAARSNRKIADASDITERVGRILGARQSVGVSRN